MIGQMARIISYFPSPLLLFNRLSLPVREIAVPSLFERGQGCDNIDSPASSVCPRDVGDCGVTFGPLWYLNKSIYLGLTITNMLIGILYPALPCWRSWSSYRTGHDAVVSWIFGTEDNAWARWSNL
jgi:hypothetical protein